MGHIYQLMGQIGSYCSSSFPLYLFFFPNTSPIPARSFQLGQLPMVIDEGMTPRVLDIGLPATAQKQDGHSKPKTN
jgi:hypothetical protein